jgi:hypothetical protein
MTLRRRVLERRAADELDSLIRWVLRGRVTGASPPSWVWECIRARAGRPTVWSLLGLWLSRGYRVVMAQLASLDAFLSAQIAFWMWPQDGWVDWRRDPRLTRLLDQYGFLLGLAF